MTRDLESEPLQLGVFVHAGAGQLVILVVLVNQVLHDRESLPALRSATRTGRADSEYPPNGEITVMVIDEGGDATVGVDLQVFWPFMFLLAEIKVHRLVLQPEFFENDSDFPKNWIDFQMPTSLGRREKLTSRWVPDGGCTG